MEGTTFEVNIGTNEVVKKHTKKERKEGKNVNQMHF